MMIGSQSYESAFPHKSARIYLDTATALLSRKLKTTGVEKGQERWAAGISFVEVQKMEFKSESVMKNLPWGTLHNITTV